MGGTSYVVSGTVALGAPTENSRYKVNTTVTFTSGHTMTLTRTSPGGPAESGTWNFINGFAETIRGTDSGMLSWGPNDTGFRYATNTYLVSTYGFSSTGLKVAFAKNKWNTVVPELTADHSTYKNFYIDP